MLSSLSCSLSGEHHVGGLEWPTKCQSGNTLTAINILTLTTSLSFPPSLSTAPVALSDARQACLAASQRRSTWPFRRRSRCSGRQDEWTITDGSITARTLFGVSERIADRLSTYTIRS